MSIYESDDQLHQDSKRLKEISSGNFNIDDSQLKNRLELRMIANAIKENTEAINNLNETLKQVANNL